MEKTNLENDKIINCPKCQKSFTSSYIKANTHASHSEGLYCPNCSSKLDNNKPTGSKEKEIKKIKRPQKEIPSHCPHCGRYITRSSVANVKDPICQSCGNYVLKKYNRKVKDLEFEICPYCNIDLTIPNELINAETLMCSNCHNNFRNPHFKGNLLSTSQKDNLQFPNDSNSSWYNSLNQKQKIGFKRLIFMFVLLIIIVLFNVIPDYLSINRYDKLVTNSNNNPSINSYDNSINQNSNPPKYFKFKSTLTDIELTDNSVHTKNEICYHTFDLENSKVICESTNSNGVVTKNVYPIKSTYKDGVTYVFVIGTKGIKEIWFSPTVNNLGYDLMDGTRLACYNITKIK